MRGVADGTLRALLGGMQLDAFAVSVTGRRAHNEDAVCARPELGLFVVADGMGGYEGGEIASQVAVAAIEELVARTAADHDLTWPYPIDVRRDPIANEVAVATRLAADRVSARRVGHLAQMGTTVAVLRVEGEHAVVAHVGDSRVYRLRAGRLEQLTIDHSLWAQLVAAGGELPAREDFAFRHVVTRALGTPSAEAELRVEEVRIDDVYLLCSDGLSEVIEAQAMVALLERPPAEAARALVELAYAAGSRDNISAVVVRVGP